MPWMAYNHFVKFVCFQRTGGGGSSLGQILIEIKHNREMVVKICPNMKRFPSLHPTFPVHLSTWEILGYIWL